MSLFVGADEVGRGAFAGPVVAGAVILPPEIEKVWNEDPTKLPVVIRDSKKMTALQRRKAAEWIRQNAVSHAVGEGSVEMINSAGIMKALQFAFRSAIGRAAKNHEQLIKKLLVDALIIQNLDHFPIDRQEAIIRGDSISCHIAAASIIAKVHRDNLMEELSGNQDYSIYKWHSNKGYGTKEHRDAIASHGVCIHHRTQFVRRSSFQS